MHVWTYWEGESWPHIDLCLETATRRLALTNVEFHLLAPETVEGYLSPGLLHERYKEIPQIGPKVSAIRAALLAKYGGWWWDADTIVLRSPEKLMQKYPNANVLYMTWTRLPLRILNGYIYAKAGSEPALLWLERINYLLEHDFETATKWLELGEKVITPLFRDRLDCVEVDRRLFLPIDFDTDPYVFFREGDFRDYLRDDALQRLKEQLRLVVR
ncbi:glycosyltransferase [Candidatus Magnetobacterium casense]|uniref:Capsular polysaccharide synthesis protein n=1 Tax=Candidatus Magnetobacterium casense TaxID=1455061 RepID=A0ABS6S3M3_9BACT|nr:glycosyltransferase [Candidatus Magnetobacterium casensis]MBV6343459.1 hypothetical protein [Candidatus Magnetobacterium casensis]